MAKRAIRLARMREKRSALLAQDSGAATMQIDWKGFEDVIAKLMALPESVNKRAIPRAIRKIAKIILANQQRLVPSETGALKDSLTIKYRSYPPRGDKMGARVAVVGPASKYERKVTRTRGKWGKREWRAKPAWYAHLVNAGAGSHNMIKDGAIAKLAKSLLGARTASQINRHPHPGMRGVRFRERSVNKQQFMELLIHEIIRAVNREARKKGVPRRRSVEAMLIGKTMYVD